MEEIQAQIDEILSRLDENDSSLSDFSDSLDTTVNDIQTTLDDQAQSIQDLTETSGQLAFPLSQETIDLIKEQFPSGFITLTGGVGTLTDARISTVSVILLTVAVAPSGTQGLLSYAATPGQAIITSTSNTDDSVVAYLILN